MEKELSGYIDRLDCCIDKDKQKYHFRIIDYKSGQQDTYDKENRNGILVQHFIYKYAIEQIAEKLLPEKNMPYVLDSARYECILEWNKKNQYSLLKIDGATLMAGLPDSVWQKLEEYFLGQANLYTATGEECSYCSYKKICQNTLKGIKKVKK
jgi:hypothetical protein